MRAHIFARTLLTISFPIAFDAFAQGVPATWEPRGIGGGGALFDPAFSPHDDRMFVACDMSELFRSDDIGRHWSVVPATETQAWVQTAVRFTADPDVLYAILWNYATDVGTPGRSDDGGLTWTAASGWPEGDLAQKIYADPSGDARLLVATEGRVYYSDDRGASFRDVHAHPPGIPLFVAGAFFDGDTAYLGGESGLLRLDLGAAGATFQPVTTSGWPAGPEPVGMAEMAAAREGGTVRILAIASASTLYLDNGDPYFYEDIVWGDYAGIYRLDLDDAAPGVPAWTRRDTGFKQGALDPGSGCPVAGARDDRPTHIAMSGTDIDIAYAGGYPSPCSGEDIRVYRTLDGGDTWTSALVIGSQQNAETGWAGFGSGDRTQTYDAPLRGIAMRQGDPDRVAFSGNGFIHVTENATDPDGVDPASGVIWRQAYTDPVTIHPPGQPTPTRQYYRSSGLESTSVWDLAWSDATHLFAGFSDIRAIRSEDGGASWAFDYEFSGHERNSTYRVARHPAHPDGTLYAVTSGIHDLYQSHRSRDQYANDTTASRTGLLMRSVDKGETWKLMHDFGRQIVWLEIDPSNAERAFVSVLYYSPGSGIEEGGIYMTSHLSTAMAASDWTRLPSPPRTEGRPFNVRVLPDAGGLVASYSVRRTDGGAYTESSGVFFKPTLDATDNWEDRSDDAMHYWTKDVVLDTIDPASTWYAGVFSNSLAPDAGGLYRTADAGQHWSNIFAGHSVESFTVAPGNPDLGWVSTLSDGLWVTTNLRAATPTFERDAAYPFGHPLRVIYNPNMPDEAWILSFGNGMRVAGVPGDGIFASGFELLHP